jgi:hypothetical protein
MSRLSRNQKLVVVLMGVADLIVMLLLCVAVVFSLQTLPQTQGQAAAPKTGAISIASRTPIPTWTPEPTATPYVRLTATLKPLRDEDAAVLDQVEWDVATLRGLRPQYSVARWKISTLEMRRRFVDTFLGEDAVEEARAQVLVLSTLDFMSPSVDLLKLWEEGFAEGIAGFYLPETEEIYIISNDYAVGALERVIYAHEFGHALQDQHFDLETLGLDVTGGLESTDRLLGIKGLVEGDASLIEEQYVYEHFTLADAVEVLNKIPRGIYLSDQSEPVPLVLGELSAFPYVSGREFVGSLYDRGGWLAVDAAFANPPVSTEHIMHPERYLAGDQPVPVASIPLTDTLGSGWRLIYDDTGGELLLGLYLENHLSAARASAAAGGWGGDRCVVYYSETTEEKVLVWIIVWDTLADADEFFSAYRDYADDRFDHAADETTADGWTCWSGYDALCVIQEGSTITLVIGPDRATVDRVRAVISPE